MTQDEIVEMVKKAGWSGIYSSWTSPTNRTSLTVPVTMQQLEAFAKLVAAKATAVERKACAKVADEYAKQVLEHNFSKLIAHNIRARGDKHDTR